MPADAVGALYGAMLRKVNTTYRVGIYARLSRDDERQGESVSIENQKLMLRHYCTQQGWEVVETYVDDGWSGTNFDRPGFCRMMEDVREKKIDLVLVKDLSRLGRDYIEVGKYTDCVFPYYGCRFVALNDGVDTLRQTDDVTMIFKNVINDIYARDTSKKIRAVRRANAESGKFMGYKAPYGYLRSPGDKHRLVVDPPASEVVRRIFALRREGWGMQAIADALNEDRIPPPRDYELGISLHLWRRETVRSILGNEAYIGNLVQLKQGSLSYKDRRQRQKPPETWVRISGTHEPIVETAVWEAVRALDRSGQKFRRSNGGDLLAGLVFCAVCGKPMGRIVNYKCRGGEQRTYPYYICRGHGSISGTALKEILIQDLRFHTEPLLEEGLSQEVWQELRQKREGEQLRKKRTAEKRVRELENLLCRLYEERAKGEIASPAYECLMARYEKERKEMDEIVSAPMEHIENVEACIRKELAFERLLKEMIERVEIGPKKSIHICYRFQEAVLL